MQSIPEMRLNDGNTIPVLAYGLGSNNMHGNHQQIVDVTLMAIQCGYYHLDCAEAYGNEAALGAAIRESGVPRDKLFITTKVSGMPGQDVHASLNASLEKLGLEFVDLYLIHLPFAAPTEMPRMWGGMESIRDSGKAKSIGVSNFLQTHLEPLLERARIPPAINQIEYHPYLQHGSLVNFCHKNNIAVSAYSTLTAITRARPGPVDGAYADLAAKYGVTDTDIAIKWCIDQDVAVITTSSSKARLEGYKANMAKFKLLANEVESLSKLGQEKHYRVVYNNFFAAEDRS